MKVLIYKPGLNDGSGGELPNLGMGILASELTRFHYDVIIYDGHFKKINRYFIGELIRNVGIICLSLTSQEWELEETQWVINEAFRQRKIIILGGPHAYAYWDILEHDKRLDQIVVGEVDRQIEKILYNFLPVFYMQELYPSVMKIGRAKEFSTPDFSKLIGKEDMLGYPLYTSRGCTQACAFCMGGQIHRGWVKRSLDIKFWDEIENLKQFPKLKRVYVIDDCFSADLPHAKEFLFGWKSQGYSDQYELSIMNVRADQIDEELLNLMVLCGVKELPIGVESADPTVFKYVGKGETLEDIHNAILMIQKAGITPWLNMIVGLPYDNPERHQNSLNWVLEQPDPKIVHWFQYSPFRSTKAYNWLLKHEAIEDGFIPKAYGRRYDEFPWIPDHETKDFSKDQRARAQLEGYLACNSPILSNTPNLWEVCCKYGLGKLFWQWDKKAPIQEYKDKNLKYKQDRGQI